MSDDQEPRRLPYAACRGEGQNACVIGPHEEVVVEITHGAPEAQCKLASRIASMLNENHTVSYGGLLFGGPHIIRAAADA